MFLIENFVMKFLIENFIMKYVNILVGSNDNQERNFGESGFRNHWLQ